MSNATDYLEDQTLARFFANQTPDGAVDGPQVALWTTTPANSPDAANEVDSTNEYSRFETTSADWTQTSAGGPVEYENSTALDFGVLNSGGSTTVEGVVLADGNGNFLFANGDVSEVVDAGNEFKINAGDATFSMD